MPFVDLSTGINPHPYPISALPEAACTRLPEPELLADLQRIAATAYGAADPAMVVAAPGTQILISLLPHLLGVRDATILGPTYAEHQAAWMAAGAEVHVHRELDGFLGQARAVGGAAILCNPNNPDGRRTEAPPLLSLCRDLARSGGMLIVDEAFADLETPDPGLAPHLPAPGLMILRSFGKAYGLAGLRLGFLLADAATAARIRAALGPWAVSGHAIIAGSAALADRDWRERAAQRLQQEGERLDRIFEAAGFRLEGGTRLFRLFRAGHAQATGRRLAAAGILTRRFEHDASLLRVGLPADPAAWTRLQAGLARES